MPNSCGSVFHWTSELKRHKQPKTFKKGSLYSLTYLSKNKGRGPIQTLLHFYISSSNFPPRTHSPPASHCPVVLPRNLSAITHLLCLLSQAQEPFSFHFSSPLTEFLTLRPLSLSSKSINYIFFLFFSIFILFGCTRSL